MAISTIPLFTGDVPDRNQQSAPVFTVNAIDWLDYQVIQIPATNATVEGINLAVVSIDANTISAAASADSANISDISSQSNANFKGRWSDATGAATIPATYSNNGQTWQLLQDIADITADEPLPGASNWQVVNDVNMANVRVSFLDNPLAHLLKKNKFVETLKGNVSVTRNTVATRVGINGIVRDVAIDDPREEETGWLFEGESENLFLHSDEFDNAAWLKSIVGSATAPIITANAGVAPDGTATADRIEFAIASDLAANRSLLRQTVTTVTEGTLAIYLKSNTGGSQEINLHTAGVAQLAVTVTTEWQRFTDNQAFVGGGFWGLELVGQNGGTSISSDILVWRANVEELPFPSSGIKTVATTETRSADDQSFPSAENFRESEGAIFLKADVIGDTGADQYILYISDGTDTNRVIVYRTGDKLRLLVTKDSVTQAVITTTFNMDAGIQYTVAINYKEGNAELFVDAVSIGSDLDFSPPIGLTTVQVGERRILDQQLFGHIQDLRFYDRNLTLDEIKYLGGT